MVSPNIHYNKNRQFLRNVYYIFYKSWFPPTFIFPKHSLHLKNLVFTYSVLIHLPQLILFLDLQPLQIIIQSSKEKRSLSISSQFSWMGSPALMPTVLTFRLSYLNVFLFRNSLSHHIYSKNTLLNRFALLFY